MARARSAEPRVSTIDWLKADPEALVRKQYVPDIKASDDPISRLVTFVISTSDVDRDNDVVDQSGWDLNQYRANPVVLWAHDYSSLPVARCTRIAVENGKLVAEAEFAQHPFADTVFRLIKGGFIRAVSVGFRPLEYSMDEQRGGINFSRAELLEWSCVPVPANPNALIAAEAAGIDLAPVKAWADAVNKALGRQVLVGGDTTELPPGERVVTRADKPCPTCDGTGKIRDGNVTCPDCNGTGVAPKRASGSAAKGADPVFAKGVSPKDVSMTKAPEDQAWSAPSLTDLLGDTTWGDATDAQKTKVAGHFAWANAMPPDTFGDCKIPHHDDGGKVVWRGVAAAAARLNQTDIPAADNGKVKAHLARHYRQFEKDPPWEASAAAWTAYVTAAEALPAAKRSDAALGRLLQRNGFTAEGEALMARGKQAGADAGEEAAELVQYQTLAAMLDGIDGLHDTARGLVESLITAETDPDGTVDEDSEEEIEAARLQAVRALCAQMMGGLVGVLQLVSAMCEDDDDDGPANAYAMGLAGMVGKAASPHLKTIRAAAGMLEKSHGALKAASTALDPDDGNASEETSVPVPMVHAKAIRKAAGTAADVKDSLKDVLLAVGGDEPGDAGVDNDTKRSIKAAHAATTKAIPHLLALVGHMDDAEEDDQKPVFTKAHLAKLAAAHGLLVKAHDHALDAIDGLKPKAVSGLLAKRGRALSAANEAKLKDAHASVTTAKAHVKDVLAEGEAGGDTEGSAASGGRTKAGRAISAANAEKLQKAIGHMTDGMGGIKDVLDSVAEGPMDPDTEPGSSGGTQQGGLARRPTVLDAEVLVLEPDPDERMSAEFRQALQDGVRDVVRDIVRSETAVTLDRLRGRVD